MVLAEICFRGRFEENVFMPSETYPCSPKIEIDGLPYFARMCEKIRLHAANDLHSDLHANLGIGMDEWTCQFLGISYEALQETVLAGKTDIEALKWARHIGIQRLDCERQWWCSYMRNVGFQDSFADLLKQRINESGLDDREDIFTMFDYIDADEGR